MNVARGADRTLTSSVRARSTAEQCIVVAAGRRRGAVAALASDAAPAPPAGGRAARGVGATGPRVDGATSPRRRVFAAALVVAAAALGAGGGGVHPAPMTRSASTAPVPEGDSPVTYPTTTEPPPDAAAPVAVSAADGNVHVDGGGVSIALLHDGSEAVVRAREGGGDLLRFPLTATWPGRRAPSASSVTSRGGGLLVTRSDRRGVAELDALVPVLHGVAVEVSARPSTGSPVTFLSDGERGVELSSVDATFSPDDGQVAPGAHPAVRIAGWHAFSPAPLQLSFASRGRWVGVGVVEVPAAREVVFSRGGMTVDYPAASGSSDLGAGVASDGLVHFPRLVVTLAGDPLAGLRAYHDALVDLDAAPEAARPGPPWWRQPMCDTWGEQTVTRAVRDSEAFTADWVRRFASSCRRRLGTSSFTLVVDARWQRLLGEPEPAKRFGGTAGMRALVDGLHAQGAHVLLWWPLWVEGSYSGPPPGDRIPPSEAIDPQASDFAARMASRMEAAVGTGPGQLAADGLKIDWEYNLPPGVAGGMRALYGYLARIHDAVVAVRPDALVDASSASPQFAAVTDDIRLNDARTGDDWPLRARILVAADPGTLIDGDGWVAGSEYGLRHYVESAVFGIPALYYVTRWADGVGLARDQDTLRAVTAVTSARVGGSASWVDGRWRWTGDDGSTVEQLGPDTVIAIDPGCAMPRTALVTAIAPTEVTLPPELTVTAIHGSALIVERASGGRSPFRLLLQPGAVVHLDVATAC